MKNRKTRETVLHFAVRGGNESIIKKILNKGADPTIQSSVGTPKELAKQLSRPRIVAMISEHIDKTEQYRMPVVSRVQFVKNAYKPTATIVGLGTLRFGTTKGRLGLIQDLDMKQSQSIPKDLVLTKRFRIASVYNLPQLDVSTPEEQPIIRIDDGKKVQLKNKIERVTLADLMGQANTGTQRRISEWEAVLDGVPVIVQRVQIHDAEAPNTVIDIFSKEIYILKGISHPNLSSYYGLYSQEGEVNIVMETRLPEGAITLLDLLEKEKLFSERVATHILVQILEPLWLLHNNSVVHGNLNPTCITIHSNGLVKVSDYSSSVHLVDRVDTPASDAPWYSPPEVVRGEEVTASCDSWSVGCILLLLLTGSPPYADYDAFGATFHIIDGEPPLPPGDVVPLTSRCFLVQCFNPDPLRRPLIGTLSKDELIKQYVVPGGDSNIFNVLQKSADPLSTEKIREEDIKNYTKLIEESNKWLKEAIDERKANKAVRIDKYLSHQIEGMLSKYPSSIPEVESLLERTNKLRKRFQDEIIAGKEARSSDDWASSSEESDEEDET